MSRTLLFQHQQHQGSNFTWPTVTVAHVTSFPDVAGAGPNFCLAVVVAEKCFGNDFCIVFAIFSFYRVASQPVGLSVSIRSLLQSHLLCSLLLVAPIFWNLVEPRLEPSCLLVSAGIHKISEPSGTKLGTKLFASLCWESPTFGTKWNQVEPRLEPSCLLVSAGNLTCIPGLLSIIII